MVTTIFIGLLLLMVIMLLIVPYAILKSVNLGLRWQMETKQDIKPTMPNIISEQIEKKEQQRQEQITNTILNEYLNGGDPK